METKVKIRNTEKLELMIINKCPLKNIIKNQQLLFDINDSVISINKIIIQLYQFLRLYLLNEYRNKRELPLIDINFIKNIIKTITKRQDTRGKPPGDETKILLEKLEMFYESDYKQCVIDEDVIDNTKMNFIMAYEAIDTVKNIENNISEHFIDYVNKFVNITFNVKDKLNKVDKLKISKEEKKTMKKEISTEFRKVKNDLLKTTTIYDSDKKYHMWLNQHRTNIIRKEKFDKDSIYYDVCSNSQDYLKSIFYINEQLEKMNDSIKNEKEQIKLFQVIPQRKNIIPKYITLDTCGLINLVIKENIKEYLDNVEKHQNELWEKYFKLHKRVFKRKNYSFHFMIKTDGVGCSVLLHKMKDGKPIKITYDLQRKTNELLKTKDKYIEEIEITEEMKKKKIVVIDPNMSDLIHCLTKTSPVETTIKNPNGNIISYEKHDDNITFRYTQNQRRLETRNKKYNKIIQTINTTTKIDEKTVKEYETILSNYNSKTMNYKKYIDYCKKKNEINRILFEHYKEYIFRKLKLNRFINTQKSENKMLKNFEKKFGSPKNVIIVIGDFDKKEGFKGKEPTICKRFRRLFRNFGYEVYLINEFRTSKLCNVCEHECENFLERKSKKPHNKDELTLCWGLLCCNNTKCKMIHNRDKNACLNMYKIVKSIFAGKGRPEKYCHSLKEETSFPLNDGK